MSFVLPLVIVKKKRLLWTVWRKQTDPYFADFVNSVTASEAFNSTASESAPGIGASDFAESCRTSTSPIVGSLTSLWTTEISAPGNFDSMKLCNCSRWAYPSGTSMVIWNPSNTSTLSSRPRRCAMLTAAKKFPRRQFLELSHRTVFHYPLGRLHCKINTGCFFSHLLTRDHHAKHHSL